MDTGISYLHMGKNKKRPEKSKPRENSLHYHVEERRTQAVAKLKHRRLHINFQQGTPRQKQQPQHRQNFRERAP